VSTTDLAGLSTSDVEGAPVGELVGALSEERTGLIRYLDVSIRDAGKHVLVPIGHARIDRESVPPRVRLRAATHGDLLSVPEFVEDETPVDAEYQEAVMGVHGRLFYGARYYAHPAYDHSALHVGDARVLGTTAPAEEGLRALSESGSLALSRSGPDLSGWQVVDEDGETVGALRDFLVDPSAGRVRYAVVDLASPERPTALPIGYIAIEEETGRARVPTLTVEDIRLLPPYEPPLTREEENRLHAAIEGRLTGERYFDRPDFRRPNGAALD
jgi:sporulation protein YlmC with PRC-barrel domain